MAGKIQSMTPKEIVGELDKYIIVCYNFVYIPKIKRIELPFLSLSKLYLRKKITGCLPVIFLFYI